MTMPTQKGVAVYCHLTGVAYRYMGHDLARNKHACQDPETGDTYTFFADELTTLNSPKLWVLVSVKNCKYRRKVVCAAPCEDQRKATPGRTIVQLAQNEPNCSFSVLCSATMPADMYSQMLLSAYNEAVVVLCPHLKCPITQGVIEDPYVGSDGRTYSFSAIKMWIYQELVRTGTLKLYSVGHDFSAMTDALALLLMKHVRSPVTRQMMTSLVPNYAMSTLLCEIHGVEVTIIAGAVATLAIAEGGGAIDYDLRVRVDA